MVFGRRIFSPQKGGSSPPRWGKITLFPRFRGRSEFPLPGFNPPRGWGKNFLRVNLVSTNRISRFIPTRWGKIATFSAHFAQKAGSSPRGGENGYVHNFFGIRDGSSPRGGENMDTSTIFSAFGTVHPHAVGKIFSFFVHLVGICGSSPRGGENTNFTNNFGHKFRFIPTRWGKYNFLSAWGIGETVHPHAVGKIFSAGTQ